MAKEKKITVAKGVKVKRGVEEKMRSKKDLLLQVNIRMSRQRILQEIRRSKQVFISDK